MDTYHFINGLIVPIGLKLNLRKTRWTFTCERGLAIPTKFQDLTKLPETRDCQVFLFLKNFLAKQLNLWGVQHIQNVMTKCDDTHCKGPFSPSEHIPTTTQCSISASSLSAAEKNKFVLKVLLFTGKCQTATPS